MSTLDHDTSTQIHQNAVEEGDMVYVGKLPISIKIDGDMWCVLWGKNLQDGVAGFGQSPIDAIRDFNKNMNRPLTRARKKLEG